MSKGSKLMLIAIGWFVSVSLLHIWLNVGFDKLGFIGKEKADDSFRVGFLPVT